VPFEKIKQMISEQFGVDDDMIDMDTAFSEDLNADSLDIVELIMAIEGEFDISVEDKDVESISTVGDIVNYIKNRM
jgi:acyl carrier protein